MSVAQKIGNGHAYSKHGTEFGVSDSDQLSFIVENIMKNPSEIRILSRGRTAYWDVESGAVVITDPNQIDGGTIFKPAHGKLYFDNMR